jgi:DNA-binding transcriptional MerR regulator
MDGFSTTEVERLTGVSSRVLHYWDATRFLSPSLKKAAGSGSRRRYSYADVVAIRVATQLRGAGIPLQGLRRVISFLTKKFPGKDDYTNPLSARYLVSDGRDVFVSDEHGLMSVLHDVGQRRLFHVIHLSGMVKDLEDEIVKLERPAKPAEKASQVG